MIKGLYQELADKTAQRAASQARLADPEISANERHSLEWKGGDLNRAIERIGYMIAENEAWIVRIGELLEDLADAPDKTDHRTLATMHLEDAQSRILRELGDKPA